MRTFVTLILIGLSNARDVVRKQGNRSDLLLAAHMYQYLSDQKLDNFVCSPWLLYTVFECGLLFLGEVPTTILEVKKIPWSPNNLTDYITFGFTSEEKQVNVAGKLHTDGYSVINLDATLEYKAKWNVPFVVSPITYDSIPGSGTKMILCGEFKVFEDDSLNCTFVEVPFIGEPVTLTVVLPKGNTTLSNLNITEILQKKLTVHKKKMTIFLPTQIQIQTHTEFHAIMEWVQRVFKTEKKLWDKDYPIHETIIDINPLGVLISSSSNIGFKVKPKRMLSESGNTVFTDEPFIFYVKHEKLGFLSIGRYLK